MTRHLNIAKAIEALEKGNSDAAWHLLRAIPTEMVVNGPAPVQQEPDAFVQREAIRTLSGGANHVPATLTLNDDGGKAVAVFLSPQPAPVQGWKLVPVEPTQKMLDAPPNAYSADALVTWKAMIAVAPQPAPVLSAGPITPEMANWGDADKAKLTSVLTQHMVPQPAQHTGVGLTDDLKRAIESMIESHEAGDLDGWEVQLVKRRLHEATNGIKGVA